MEEITRRRQQSDLASAEIGKLLLKGWAMLADECPSIPRPYLPLLMVLVLPWESEFPRNPVLGS